MQATTNNRMARFESRNSPFRNAKQTVWRCQTAAPANA